MWAPRSAAPPSCLPTIPSTPRLLSANPVVSAGPQGPCEPGHWEGIRGPALPCFALLHNGLIKDIPGMTALSKRGQLSSAKGTASHQYCAVPMWGSCIQACPPHVNQPVHPTLDTHRLSHQTQYRFAWPAHLVVPAPNTGLVWPAQPCRQTQRPGPVLWSLRGVVCPLGRHGKGSGHCLEDTQSHSSALCLTLGVLSPHCWHFVGPRSPDTL